jgi:anthranilate phosphoribosyltransferase
MRPSRPDILAARGTARPLQRLDSHLRGGAADENARALTEVLKGAKGPFRDVAVLNAAAGLMVAGRAKGLQQAVALAQRSVDSGEARSRLQRLITVSNG